MNLLIANRGEIAVRVIRTARAEGWRTIAVYSQADVDAPHVHAADDAVLIGPAAPRDSYLNIDRIIAAARGAGADAVHPGYGFLSENADFAEACAAAGLNFVGPTPDVIRLMGDKAAAKRRVATIGVPILPGYHGEAQDDERLIAESRRIGFPVMVKAAAGGGGKGMRLVGSAADLSDALAAARREAMTAFGSDGLILERALLAPRHVEIQVLADKYGKVIALGERDCSIQRRHQKIIEEAPSPALDDGLRAAMSKAAVRAAVDIGYVGVGTVEFLLDQDGSFAFLEMNTRLQVEHPVTEMITGLDLVAWQLRIASGDHLAIDQEQVRLTGHAIEARLYAEDANHMPSAGRIELWSPPAGTGVRVDSGIVAGYTVTPNYDPMLAKIIGYGATREEARQRLIAALERTTLLGISTNRAFLIAILRDRRFASGKVDTAFLSDLTPPIELVTIRHYAAVAAALQREYERRADLRSPGLAGWTNGGSRRAMMHLAIGDERRHVVVDRRRGGFDVQVDGTIVEDIPTPMAHRVVNPRRVVASFPAHDIDASDVVFAPARSAEEAGSGVLRSPFHGSVSLVFVEVGDTVQAGDKIAVVETMKMEHPIMADIAGAIVAVPHAGAQVAAGDILARIERTERP